MNSAFERSTPREQTSASIDQAAAEVAEINGRIDGALRALDDLVNHPASDLKRQYRVYEDSLDKLEAAAERLRVVSDEMQASEREYFVEWDREIAALHNEDLRDRSADRRADVAQRFDAIRDRYIAARERLAPFVRRLSETSAALEMDLTPGGINSVRPTIESMTEGAGPAREALRELADELRRASVALAPTSVQPDPR